MKFLGLLVTLGGWLITMAGLVKAESNMGKGMAAVIGIAVSLFGIFGLINASFLKNAPWKD